MDKRKLVEAIRLQLEKDVVALKAAALETYAAATGEESQPENEYDTRAVEASYLAGAQSKRALEIEESLTVYKLLNVRDFNEETPIAATAFVELVLNGKTLYVFIVPAKSAMTINFDGRSIQVITPQSPLGGALYGLKTGDTATVDANERQLEYEIVGVL